jgi:hypothetical protein
MYFLNSPTACFWNNSHPKKKLARNDQGGTFVFMYITRYSCKSWMIFELFFLDKFSKISQISNLMNILSVAVQLFYADGRSNE